MAACLFLGLLLLLLVIQDAAAWHVIPLIVIVVLAEVNRAYTYECAVEEMPAGYADALMEVSPTWALPVVVISGIILSVLISNITAKLFKLEK